MSDSQARDTAINGSANAIGNNNRINNTFNNFAGGPPVVSALHQIPAPPPDFTGREQELTELRAAMARGGVAISGLTGMGGVGKSVLAYQLAGELKPRYPDADLYLDLKGVEANPVTVTAALQHFIRAFHPQAQLPDDVAQLRATYLSVLSEQSAIVLLDNAKDAAQVAALMPPPTCATIVTSRRYFIVPRMKLLRLGTLKPEDAHTLLLEVASRIGDCAPEMARVLDYLPLALRLAASALDQRPDLTPETYLRRLNDAKTRLGLTDDNLIEGPRSIEATLQLSYDLLTPSRQVYWRALAVFPDRFEKSAAAALWETELDATTDILADLHNFSMVDFEPTTGRYRLHDLARDFAALRLSDDEKHAAASRHALHYFAVLSDAKKFYKQGHDGVLLGLKHFDSERINISAGQAWSASQAPQNPVAAQLCILYPDAGIYVLDLRLSPAEQIAWLDSSLAAARQLKRRDAEGVALGSLGNAYADLGEPRRAIEFYEQHLDISREIGDRRGEGNALGNLGLAYANLGEPRRAIEFYEQHLDISREIGDRRGEGNALGSLGNAYADLGEPRRAIEYHEQNIVIAREIGDRRGEGNALGNLGSAYANLGEPRRAIEYHEQNIVIAREIGDRRGEGNALWNVSTELIKSDDRNAALQLATQALQIFEQIESPHAAMVRQVLARWQSESAGRYCIPSNSNTHAPLL